MTQFLWQQYRQNLARDIAWLCFAPPLLSVLGPYSAFVVPGSSKQLNSLLARIESQAIPTGPSRDEFSRLGLYYEALVHYFIDQCRAHGIAEIEILNSHLQIEKEKRTLGELDFILRKNDEYIHLESAVKFYLCAQTGNSEWQNWVGPNARDRLDKKLLHMQNHQLPMGKQADVFSERSEFIIQGMLFYRKGQTPLPRDINQSALTGCWLYEHEFLQEIKDDTQTYWHPLTKTQWLTGVHPHQLENQAELTTKTPASHAIPGLFQTFSKEPRLTEKGFTMVVKNHWPEINSPSRKI